MSRGDASGPLRIARFDRREANAIEVGEELYMLLDGDDPVLVPARCPHRGGPLHLATVEHGAHGAVLVCPWHGTSLPFRALLRRAVATVRSGDIVHGVIDAPSGEEIVARRIPIHQARDGACAGSCMDPHKKAAPRT